MSDKPNSAEQRISCLVDLLDQWIKLGKLDRDELTLQGIQLAHAADPAADTITEPQACKAFSKYRAAIMQKMKTAGSAVAADAAAQGLDANELLAFANAPSPVIPQGVFDLLKALRSPTQQQEAPKGKTPEENGEKTPEKKVGTVKPIVVAVGDILREAKGKRRTGIQIIKELKKRGFTIKESTFRRHVMRPAADLYGIKNDNDKMGYYIP